MTTPCGCAAPTTWIKSDREELKFGGRGVGVGLRLGFNRTGKNWNDQAAARAENWDFQSYRVELRYHAHVHKEIYVQGFNRTGWHITLPKH